MRYNRDGYSVEAAIVKGRALPEWYLDEPQLQIGDHFYITAFSDLNSCRQVGMGVGEIPWDKVIEYGRYKGLDDTMMEVFRIIMKEMDRAFLRWQDKERDKQRRANDRRNRSGRKQVMPKEDYIG